MKIRISALCLLVLSFFYSTVRAYASEGRDFNIKVTGTGYIAYINEADGYPGRSLAELVSFLPDITYDDGECFISGMKAAGIYVNGSKVRDASVLKRMQSSGVSSIEVSYAASGDSSSDSDGGAVYVTTSSGAGELSGFVNAGGSVLGTGSFDNASVSSFLMYGPGRFRVTNYLDYSAYRHNTVSEEIRYGADEGTGTGVTVNTVSGSRHGFKEDLGLEYDIDSVSKASAAFAVNGTLDNPVTGTLYSGQGMQGSDSSVTGNRVDHVEYKFGAGYSTVFGSGKVGLSLSLDYVGKDETRENSYILAGEGADRAASSGDLSSIHTDVIESEVSFRVPVGEKTSISAGAGFDAVLSSYRLRDSYGENAFDDNVSSASTEGYTVRAYALASGSLWKVRYRAGVNLQTNIISYSDHTYSRSAGNTQYSASPTVKLLYPFGKGERHSVSLTYRHSLGNIPYRAITPYRYWSDRFNYTTGNTDLKSPGSDVLMSVVSLYEAKVNLGLSYRYDRNQIYFRKSADSVMEDVICTRPVNLDGSHILAFNADAAFSPAKWMRSVLHVEARMLKEATSIDGVDYDGIHGRYYLSLDNSFSLGRGFGADLSGMWRSGYRMYEKTYSAIYSASGSLYRTFLSGRLRVAIDFTFLASGERYRTLSGGISGTSSAMSDILNADLSERRYAGLSAGWTF